MKMTRQELKVLVKECLLEVLREGLGEAMTKTESHVRSHKEDRHRAEVILDAVARKGRQQAPMKVALSEELKQRVKSKSGGNPVMASILADTAATTLPQMLASEKGGGGDGSVIGQLVNRHAPEELFGEDATAKWSQLAFMEDERPRKGS